MGLQPPGIALSESQLKAFYLNSFSLLNGFELIANKFQLTARANYKRISCVVTFAFC